MTLTVSRFEEFWAAYPRKAGKAAAFKAWQRLMPDTALYARMMAAVDLAKTTEQWQRDNGRYIPNPLTWLNQCRWDDEYTSPAPMIQVQQPDKQTGTALTRLMAKVRAAESMRGTEDWGNDQ